MAVVRRLFIVGFFLCEWASPAWGQSLPVEYHQGRRVAAQEIIVRFKPADRARNQAAIARDPDIAQSEPLGRTGATRLRSHRRTAASLLQEFASRSDVEYAEPNYLWHASEVPNDLFIGDQWGLRNTGQFFGQAGIAGADIKAVDAWNITDGSRDIVVGVIDSGVDYNHPDLSANIWSAPADFQVTVAGRTIQCAAGTHGFDAISRTCNPSDSDGHGTHITGIISGAGNNGIGISGVNRIGSVIALKFLDATGFGSTANAVAAIEFAVEVKRVFGPAANIRILNASWGSTGNFSQALLDAINLAGQNDMLFVAAAGNNSQDNDFTPHYPAGYDAFNIVSVAAVDNRDELIAFSNVGRTTIDLAAPGAEIVSTIPTGSESSLYGSRTGTSMSAPFVSGAAALVLSACGVSTAALKSHLLDSVDPVPSLAGAILTGGRLNVSRALTNCLGTVPPSFAITASPGIQTMGFRTTINVTVSTGSVGSFALPITLGLSNVPSGMTWSFDPPVVTPGQSSVLQITVNTSVNQATYTLRVEGNAGTSTRTAGILLTAGLPLSPCAFTIEQAGSGKMESTDIASIHRDGALADYCQLTMDAERPVRIRLNATGYDSELYLLSGAGDVLASDKSGNHSEIERTLQAGVYILEATTSQAARFHTVGSYSLTASLIAPNSVGIRPYSLTQGTEVSVEILGNNFYSPPFTVEVTSCQSGSVDVTDITLIDPFRATAVFRVSPTALGNCTLKVTAATGTVLGSFLVLPPPPVISSISPGEAAAGETVSVTITGSNFKPQMTVDAGFIGVSDLVFVSTTTATARLSIPSSLSGGYFSITVRNNDGTVSNSYSFLVKPGLPVLDSITPQFGLVGASITLTLAGKNFSEPLSVKAGEGIAVSDIRWLNFQTATAVLTISPSAVPGPREISVSTTMGATGSRVFEVVLPPTLTGISPFRVIQGVDSNVTLTGLNLHWGGCQINVAPPDDRLRLSSWGCDFDQARLYFSVLRDASVGDRTITVSNAVGTSNPVTLRVDPRGATLIDVAPRHGPRGGTIQMTITGSEFVAPLSINVEGGGIAVSNVIPGASAITATFSIDASAAVGKRVVSVTTPAGDSNPIEFVVTPPDYADLVVSQSQSRPFALGQNETYSLVIRNIGLGPTTGAITVTDEIPGGMDLVSGDGAGWTCVRGLPTLSGPTARCNSSSPLAAGAQSTVTITVRVYSLSSQQTRLNTVYVETDADFFPENNTSSAPTQAVFVPTLSIVVSANPLSAGQQSTVRAVIAEPYPYELVGTLQTSMDSFGLVDPAMQFATGGRTASFTIPANTVEAVFPGASGPLGFQPGTIGGVIRFTAAVGPPAFSNAREAAIQVSVPFAAPNITKVETETSGAGFTVRIRGFASARALHRVTFRFDTNPLVRLVCGTVSGCEVTGSALALDITSISENWFIYHSEFGSLFTLRFPFTVQGTVSGSIIVTLANGVGTSNPMSFPLP